MAEPDQLVLFHCCKKDFMSFYESSDHALYKIVGLVFLVVVGDLEHFSQALGFECLNLSFSMGKLSPFLSYTTR